MKKSIFQLNTYRDVIRDWVADRPRGEMKLLSEILRVPAPVFSQTLSGARELSEDHAFILCDHFGFTELEREFFICLVQIERANHFAYKTHLKKRLESIRSESRTLTSRLEHEKRLSPKDQAEFYSSWLYSAIRLFCDLSDTTSLDKIMAEFNMERDKAMKVLQFLIKKGLIVQDGSRYKMGPSRTHIGKDSPFISRHHTNWRVRAMERSQYLTEEELQFSGPMTISREDFFELREKMIGWIQDVSGTVRDSKSELLACFNLDFFFIK